MAKMVTLTIIAPRKLREGEEFEIEVELPTVEKKPRGQLAGVALEDMTFEQVKREVINSGSVLYKAKQRGATEVTIAANQARYDAALARKAELSPEKVSKAPEGAFETGEAAPVAETTDEM